MKLNSEQQAAVDSEADRVLVQACAGSGKTSVLVARIQRALSQGIDPQRIVAITFTNSSAKVIRDRIHYQLGHCGTIHSYLFKLLREYGPKLLSLPNRLTIIDDEQAQVLLDECEEHLSYKGTLIGLKQVIENYWECGPLKTAAGLVASEYFFRQRRDGTLSYDAILDLGLQLVRKLDEPIADLILLDEAQDVSEKIGAIFEDLPTLKKFAVGDQNQSIFSFCGGTPSVMERWRDSESLELFDLSKNYRSGAAICDVASAFIGSKMKSAVKRKSTVRIYQQPFVDAYAEACAVADEIRNAPGKTAAVLARTNFVADEIAKVLESFGIKVAKRTRAQRPLDWKTAVRLVQFCGDPENDAAAYWFVESTKGRKTADKMRLEACEKFQTINQRHLKIPSDLTARQILPFLARAGICGETLERVRSIADLLPENATAGDLALGLGVQEEPVTEEAGVVVTTVHQAKGREWDLVCVVGLEEGLFPSAGEGSTEREERRILYVAMTRARERLVLSCAKLRRRNQWEREATAAEPSRFLKEIEEGF